MEGPARGRGTGTSALVMKQNLCVFQKNQNKPTQTNKQTKPTKTQTTTTTKQNKNLWKKKSSIQLPKIIYVLIQTMEDYKFKQLFKLVKFSLGFVSKADTVSQDFQVK